MQQRFTRHALGVAISLALPALAQAEDAVTTLPEVTVSAPRPYETLNTYEPELAVETRAAAHDASSLLDRDYADHLGGINRVALSDVPVGTHLPGAGRFVYLGGEYRW